MAGSTAIDAELVERFKTALDRLNPDSGKIGLAVSGGPDSMAMLVLAHTAIPGGFEVATVDHGLRTESRHECALVVAACEERDVPCEVLTVEVAEGNVQAKAREARYAALHDWAGRRKLAAIATAHHANDQMETMLMRLNRGSGVSGLAAIREATAFDQGLLLIRPLLGFTRSELEAIISSAGIAVAHDPSNADASFERVRIRQALAGVDWLDPAGFAASARHLENAAKLQRQVVELWLRENARGEGDDLRHPIPDRRAMQFAILEAQFDRMGAAPRGGDLARLLEALRKGKGGNVAGILVIVEDGDWVYRPEPPRKSG